MLRLSNLADYGVVVMTAVARGQRNGLLSATQVATVTGIPVPTAAKLLGQLARAGLLTSQRGVTGGFALADSAERINLADIIEAIDGPISLTHCGQPGTDCCDLAEFCQVRPHWTPVNRAIRAALSAVPLAELSAETPSASISPAPAAETAAGTATEPFSAKQKIPA